MKNAIYFVFIEFVKDITSQNKDIRQNWHFLLKGIQIAFNVAGNFKSCSMRYYRIVAAKDVGNLTQLIAKRKSAIYFHQKLIFF
jgi:hypothetical protein